MADEEMAQVPPSEKEGLKRGVWSPEEDAKLVSFINANGHRKWRILPQEAGLNRCGKSCRLRWLNYLRPDLKRGNFTHDEEETIIRLHNSTGNKWSQIAAKLPGRTDNEIKNIWNKRLRARAESMKAEKSNKRLKAHAESLESMRVEHSRYSYSYSCWCTYSYSYSYVSLSSSLNSSNSNWNGESAEELGESKQLMLNEENEEDDNLYEGLLNLPSQQDLAISDIFEDGADCVSSPKWIQDTSSNMQVTSSDK